MSIGIGFGEFQRYAELAKATLARRASAARGEYIKESGTQRRWAKRFIESARYLHTSSILDVLPHPVTHLPHLCVARGKGKTYRRAQ